MNRIRSYLGIGLTLIWLLFTVSLAAWWIYFALEQIDRIQLINHAFTEEVIRYQRMIFWEGIVLLSCLFMGGGALFYYAVREIKEAKRIKEFFAAFTHEIKTPIASAQLQAELILEEGIENVIRERVLKILKDLKRLTLQIENSLFLADEKTTTLYFERILLSEIIESLRIHWSGIEVLLVGDGWVYADRRAVEGIISNCIQNSVVHGNATKITLHIQEEEKQIIVIFSDNGIGFQGDIKKLGSLFYRHYPRSGSGIGLYLVKKLMKANKGQFAVIVQEDTRAILFKLIFQKVDHKNEKGLTS